ncbi:MAG: orotidine 5'-phosphate decarboxylase / HUMPS family protein [Candidatus Geothermarchaeales archaeon]
MELPVSPLERIKPPALQVALDIDADLETICDVAEHAYKGGATIIEAGTPAIKRHGVDLLIPALRRAAPRAVILADLKTMDAGDLEARIAYRAGADIVSILAAGKTIKIWEALGEAQRRGKAILIDLIDCENPTSTLESLVKEFDGQEDRVVFCLHMGISEQTGGRGIHEERELISEARRRAGNFFLAVAGGIKEGSVGDVTSLGVDICVVGAAVSQSSNPEAATRRILKAMRVHYRC